MVAPVPGARLPLRWAHAPSAGMPIRMPAPGAAAVEDLLAALRGDERAERAEGASLAGEDQCVRGGAFASQCPAGGLTGRGQSLSAASASGYPMFNILDDVQPAERHVGHGAIGPGNVADDSGLGSPKAPCYINSSWFWEREERVRCQEHPPT